MNGARQFVVQDAFEMMLCSGLRSLSFTPFTTVKSTSFPGAEIMTFLAPAVMCFPAPARSRKTPVHSSTMSMPNSAQGSCAGSLSAEHGISLSPIRTPFSVHSTFFPHVPKFESYLSKCARVSFGDGSLIAANSTWSLSMIIRQTARPILPNPLIATCGFISNFVN